MSGSRNTKTITVSFPVDLAKQAEQLARTESRTMSELFREAFRTYRAVAARKRLQEGHEYARERGSGVHTEDDIEQLVEEARQEFGAERRRSK